MNLQSFKETNAIDTANLSADQLKDKFRPFPTVEIDNRPAVYWGHLFLKNETGNDLRNWVFYTGEGSFIDVFVYKIRPIWFQIANMQII